MTRIWLFGEAEYETTETFKENAERLFHVSESCGYMIEVIETPKKNQLILDGADLEHIVLTFIKDKLISAVKEQWTDRTGHNELVGSENIVVQ